MEMEGWREVVGYEGRYRVSDCGRVYSIRRNKFLVPEQHWAGHLKVDLCKGGVCKKLFVHRLVAIAFIPNPDDSPMVNHRNGNQIDNRLENLEWMTCGENNAHARYGYRQMEDRNEAF